jgi:hypothetical protein
MIALLPRLSSWAEIQLTFHQDHNIIRRSSFSPALSSAKVSDEEIAGMKMWRQLVPIGTAIALAG